jgi:hypothetical protein
MKKIRAGFYKATVGDLQCNALRVGSRKWQWWVSRGYDVLVEKTVGSYSEAKKMCITFAKTATS